MRILRHAAGPWGLDFSLVLAAWWVAFWLRFNLDVPAEFARLALVAAPLVAVAYVAGLLAARVGRQVWRFTGMVELRQLSGAVAIGGLLTAVAVLMLRLENFPRSVLLIHPLVTLVLLGAVRAGWRMLVERSMHISQGQGLVVIGTVAQAAEALRALKGSQRWRAVAILSPLPHEVGRSIQDVRVLGGIDALAEICGGMNLPAALIASPPGAPERREALLLAADSGVTLLTLPKADEWLKAEGPDLRRVELEDLLGRDPVQLDVRGLSDMLAGQTVLVTGAGGSIGSELCRQVARFGVRKLVCLDTSEYAIYLLEQELRGEHPQMFGVYYTASVREYERLLAICEAHRPAAIFHAAAYKHVPLMEEHNEIEAVRTNVLGTWHAARAAGECGTQRFVMVSTDKAVNPTNVMGASKRLAELVLQGVAAGFPRTEYVSVRFGNVLGSSGSVVPLFTSQIARGGPVTVTHPEIVRYFMTIAEAAQLVLQAGLMGRSGQIFVLDMGEPVKIVELARMLIRLSGKTEQDIPITYTGLRPGEKLYEELLADDEMTEPTPHPKLRIAKTAGLLLDVQAVAEWIRDAGAAPDGKELRRWLRRQVPEYRPGT